MRRNALLLLPLLVLGSMPPASASPTNVEIDVYDASKCPSSQGSCPSSGRVPANSQVSGILRLHARAEDPLGLRRIRIEGQPAGTKKWYCIAEHDARSDGVSSEIWFDWDSSIWPSPEEADESVKCTHTLPHIHGKPTPNGGLLLRTTAISFADDTDKASSDEVPIDLRNAPATPAWTQQPRFSSTSRAVALSWAPNQEPDLVAYAINRTGPEGSKRRLIDAKKPESSGCTRVGSVEISCSDRLPDAGGTYTYTLVALRPGGSVKCFSQTCMGSSPGQAHQVEVEAAAEASGSAPPSADPSSEPSGNETASPSPSDEPTLSSDPSPDSPSGEPVASGGGEPDAGGSALPIILALILLAGAVTLVYLRFFRPKSP